MLKLKLLLDEHLPLPHKLKFIGNHHNIRHVRNTDLKGKADESVFMGAKSWQRILVTLDKRFYFSREFKFYDDTGIIYIQEGGESYNLKPEIIEDRLKRLFKALKEKESYYNCKIKLCDSHAIIRSRSGKVRKISF